MSLQRLFCDSHDSLVTPQAGSLVNRSGVTTEELEIALGTGYNKPSFLMESIPPFKIETAAIHHYDVARRYRQII
jgi:hypothetical protein